MSDMPFFRIATAVLLVMAPGLVIGAVLFAALTFFIIPWGGGGRGIGDGTILTILAIFAILAVLPFTRSTAIGFFVTLLVATVAFDSFWTKRWWQPIGRVVSRATKPMRDEAQRKREKAEWLALWQTQPLDIDVAMFRAQQLASGCLQKGMQKRADGTVPTAVELTAPDDCRDFRRDAADIPAEWPARFHKQSDKAWRWTVAPAPEPSRWGTPGFVLTFQPESLLGRPGPIVEIDGQDVMRIRETETSPWRIARTPIPTLQRLRDCLLRVGASIDDSLQWSHLPESSVTSAGCPDLMIASGGSFAEDGGKQLQVSEKLPPGSRRIWSDAVWISYTFLAPRRFELRASNHYRNFLLSADGTAHMTTESRPARITDGPPLPCEIDPSVDC